MTRLRRYFSAHRWLTLAVAGTAVIALGGGIAYAALDGSSTNVAATSPTTTSTTLPASGAAAGSTSTSARRDRGVRGQITAISGSTWTVESRAGISITVIITPTTKFGTRAAPSSQSSFVVGSEVSVAGTRSGTTVTATRVVVPRTTAGSSSAS
jgi:hypothetical protein